MKHNDLIFIFISIKKRNFKFCKKPQVYLLRTKNIIIINVIKETIFFASVLLRIFLISFLFKIYFIACIIILFLRRKLCKSTIGY